MQHISDDYEGRMKMKHIRSISGMPLLAQDDGEVSEATQAVIKIAKTIFTMSLVTFGIKRLEEALRESMNPPA